MYRRVQSAVLLGLGMVLDYGLSFLDEIASKCFDISSNCLVTRNEG